MRTVILAASTTILFSFATAALAQDNASPAITTPVGAGLSGMADDTTWANNRVYAMPPEVDVEVTGSVNPMGCVGETMGHRLCQETLGEETR